MLNLKKIVALACALVVIPFANPVSVSAETTVVNSNFDHAHVWEMTKLPMVQKAATEEEAGYYGYRCSLPGCTAVKVTEYIPQVNHAHVWEMTKLPMVQKAATCEEDGYYGYRCSLPGCKEVNITEVIPATGHAFPSGRIPDVLVKPTCGNNGVAGYHCYHEGCNATQIVGHIAPTGLHDWIVEETEYYISYRCRNCFTNYCVGNGR